MTTTTTTTTNEPNARVITGQPTLRTLIDDLLADSTDYVWESPEIQELWKYALRGWELYDAETVDISVDGVRQTMTTEEFLALDADTLARATVHVESV